MAQPGVVVVRQPAAAKKEKVKSYKKKVTISVAVVAGMLPLGISVVNQLRYGTLETASDALTVSLTGFRPFQDSTWHPDQLRRGLTPILTGFAIHKAANWLGVNRAIAKAGIPLIRI